MATNCNLEAKHKKSYVWDYARHNLSRMLAWKVLRGEVDLSNTNVSNPLRCLLLGPAQCEWVSIPSTGSFNGSYVVWDKTNEAFVRSGKAMDCVKRKREHDRDKSKLDATSRFYRLFCGRSEDLEWYLSLVFSSKAKNIAAAESMYISASVKQGLDAAKFGGKKKTVEDRGCEMVGYLSELVDELLMDTRVNVSDAPGFDFVQYT